MRELSINGSLKHLGNYQVKLTGDSSKKGIAQNLNLDNLADDDISPPINIIKTDLDPSMYEDSPFKKPSKISNPLGLMTPYEDESSILERTIKHEDFITDENSLVESYIEFTAKLKRTLMEIKSI